MKALSATLFLVLLAGCSRPAETTAGAPDQTTRATATAEPSTSSATAPTSTTPTSSSQAATFEDRAWRVAHSTAVAKDTVYLFRSGGTLEISSPGSKPMIGSWRRNGNELVMTEESIPYRVEILELSADSFAIRSHNPGQSVDIHLVPAEGASR